MRLGLNTGYSGGTVALPMELIGEADRLGYYAVWTAEAYGSDAVAPLAWIGAQTERIHLGTAILQMAARTPAMTAMTAMTLDQLSGGRMLLGLGASGPQVVEGWHGAGYARPLTRTREYIEIVRRILAREQPLSYEGEFYQLPYRGPGSWGLGKTAQEHSPRASGPADLPRRNRPAECAAGRRAGRRLAAYLLRARVLRADLRRGRGCRARPRRAAGPAGRVRHRAGRGGRGWR